MQKFPLWLLLSAAFCAAVAPPGASARSFEEARELIRRHMVERDVPGLAVAVWRDGKVEWEEGFGWADLEGRVPATEHTMFNLASVSKTLTAVGVMTLAQAGKVDMDGPVNDYLGADAVKVWVGDPSAVTVRRVANHTSGLAGGDQFFYGAEAAHVPSMSDVIRRYGIVVAAPGERYRYSNIGYGILGQVIERVSGEAYGDYMRRAVFLPLGMTRTALDRPPALEKYQAVRYDYDRKPLPFYYSAEPASAALYSTAHDLARFGLYFLKRPLADQRSILSADSIDAMMSDAIDTQSSPVREARAGQIGYAFGWMASSQGGYRTIGHSGSASGVSTQLVLVPSAKLGLVLLSNADDGVSGLMQPLLRSLLPAWREPAPASPTAVAAEPIVVPAEMVGRWEGDLHTPEGQQPMWITVNSAGDVLLQIGEADFDNRSTAQQPAVLNDVKFDGNGLSGTTLAQIVTADTRRYPHTVSLSLKLRDGVLNGSAVAASVYHGRWVYGLPHWVALKKAEQ